MMKKTLAFILSIAMLAGITSFAEDIEALSPEPSGEETVAVEPITEENSQNSEENPKIGEEKEGLEFSESSEKNSENSLAAKDLNSELLSAAEVNAAAGKIDENLIFTGSWKNDGSKGFVLSESPNALWTFTSGAYSYTVLDEDETGLYIYCNDSYGNISNSIVPSDNSFDPSNPNNVAYWLNNNFYNGEPAATKPILIDEKIKPYITEHSFFVEKNSESGEGKWVNCRIALISYNDYLNYHDRIGYRTNQYVQNTTGMTLTRTPQKGTGSICWYAQKTGNMSNGAITNATEGYSKYMIRPTFYITRDYFKNVKADTFGSEIGKIIGECNTRESLENLGYSQKDVIKLSGSGEYNSDVSVRNVRVFGTLKPGYTLNAEYILEGGADEEESVVSWFISETEDGEFTEIAQGGTYKLKNSDGNKYIKVSVFPVSKDFEYSDEVFSETVHTEAALIPFTGAVENNSGVYSLAQYSNPSYVFIDGDYQYVCLEAEENGIFILGDYNAGRVTMSPFPDDNSFNLKASNSMAYWLNNNYLAGEKGREGKALNPNTKEYILDREYVTEGCGVPGAPNENDTVDVCKIAFLSWNELLKYQDRIGYEATDGTYSETAYENKRRLAMRTPQLGTTDYNMYSVPETGKVQPASAVKNNFYNMDIRPVMLISYDYFKNVHLDLSKLGDGVKEMLKAHISRKDLEGIYSADELSELGFGSENTEIKTDSVLTGFPKVGQQLVAESAEEENSNVEYSYKWFYADSADGKYTEISGATGKTYTVDERYEGKYIKCDIKFISKTDGSFCGSYSAKSEKVGENGGIAVIPDIELTDIYGGKRASVAVTNNTGAERRIRIVFAAFSDLNMMTLPCAQSEVSAAEGENTFDIDLPISGDCYFRITSYDMADNEPLCGVTIR